MSKPAQHLLSSMILSLLLPAALACAPEAKDDTSTSQSAASALQLNYAPTRYGIDRMWDQQGRQLLVPSGAYLIGAKSGPDNPDTNYWTKGGSATHMTNSYGQAGPAFSMNTAQVNATTIAFNMSIGPLPFAFQTLSLSFDWDQTRITKFRYSGAGFSDDCRPGFFAQTEAFFDELPQCHIVRNDQGVVVAQVGAAKVRPPSPWVEFEGNFDGKLRITFNSTGGGHFNGFFNHSHSHAFGLEFGDDAPAPQGAVYAVSGTIELLPTNSQPVGPPAPGGPDTLNAGQTLSAGQSLTSANGRYSATMQGDGNFVVSDGTTPTWSTRTAGRAGTAATMQHDGNFVLYQNGTVVLFATGTSGRAGASLKMQDDGVLVVLSNGAHAWTSTNATATTTTPPAQTPPTPATPATPTVTGTSLTAGQTLQPGQSLSSANGRFVATMQGDGNFVVYEGSRPLWFTHTDGKPNTSAVMQADGNFVLYQNGTVVVFATATHGRAGATLTLQDDGALQVVFQGSVAWSSTTTGTPAPNPTPTPTPSTSGSTMSPDTTLNSGDAVASPDGHVLLTMQGDGNFVLYENGGAVLWHTHTNGRTGARLLVQDDGGLVIAQGAQVVWTR